MNFPLAMGGEGELSHPMHLTILRWSFCNPSKFIG